MDDVLVQAFFSYSHHDWKAAERSGAIPNVLGHLFDQIERHVRAAEGTERFTKWVDQERIRWADKWSDELKHAIVASDLFFVFLSPGWLNSKVCRKELETFRDYKGNPGEKRVFVAHIRELTKKQQEDHRQILAELSDLQYKENWQSLLTAVEDTRVAACQKAGQEVAEQLERLHTIPLTSPKCATSCAPTPLSGQQKLASGRLELPTQGGRMGDSTLVQLYLTFRSLNEVETEKGTLVFSARSGTLVINASGAEIVPHVEFKTDHRPTYINILEYINKNEIEFRIVAKEGALDGNVISYDEWCLPVVTATVVSEAEAMVAGRIKLRTGDLLVNEELSILNNPSDLNATDAMALRSQHLVLARMILETHFETFELSGCKI